MSSPISSNSSSSLESGSSSELNSSSGALKFSSLLTNWRGKNCRHGHLIMLESTWQQCHCICHMDILHILVDSHRWGCGHLWSGNGLHQPTVFHVSHSMVSNQAPTIRIVGLHSDDVTSVTVCLSERMWKEDERDSMQQIIYLWAPNLHSCWNWLHPPFWWDYLLCQTCATQYLWRHGWTRNLLNPYWKPLPFMVTESQTRLMHSYHTRCILSNGNAHLGHPWPSLIQWWLPQRRCVYP